MKRKDPNKRTPEQQAFYKTKAWQNCRAGYMAKVGGLCEECKKKGLIVPAEIVHHKIPLNAELINDPETALNFDRLEALCRFCHAQKHEKAPKRYIVEADGSITIKE